MSILDEKRGRKPTGFRLHKSNWRFAWLINTLAKQAKHKTKEGQGLAMVMMEKGNPVYFDESGALQINSNSRADSWIKTDKNNPIDSETERGFIKRDSKLTAYSAIKDNVAKINQKLGKQLRFPCFADLLWANASLDIFMRFHLLPIGSKMPFDDKMMLWNLGWGNPLSLLPWTDADKIELAKATDHDGMKMSQKMIDDANQRVIKISR